MTRLGPFISYRHEDSAADARLLYDRLAARCGAENVFLDVVARQPRIKWLEEIKARGRTCELLMVLFRPIGSPR
jgi:hypothetical protein